MHHFLMGITTPPTTIDARAAFLPATDPTPGGVTVYDIATGMPHLCRLCGRSDRWLDEGATWVCEHAPVEGLAMRVIDDVRKEAVYERE